MTIRSLPALKLEHSPLILVLTQIRFSPVLKMERYVGDIQEQLRDSGLTRFSQEEIQQFVFGPEFKTNAATRWVFANRKRTEAVVLANDFFVYEVSYYDTFDVYVERLLKLFAPICRIAKLSYSEQIGMRYIDLLRANGALSVDELVCQPLRGLKAAELGMLEAKHQFQIHGKTPHGTLSIRLFENTNGQFLPPDLQAEHLTFGVNTSTDGEFRVVDFDHIDRAETDLTDAALREKLWALHDHTDRAFRCTVTPEALTYWKGADQ